MILLTMEEVADALYPYIEHYDKNGIKNLLKESCYVYNMPSGNLEEMVDLLCDINIAEVCSHIEHGDLLDWCRDLQKRIVSMLQYNIKEYYCILPMKGQELIDNFEIQELPEGWRILKGAQTAPRGWTWVYNGKSLFHKGYRSALIKDEKIRHLLQSEKNTGEVL